MRHDNVTLESVIIKSVIFLRLVYLVLFRTVDMSISQNQLFSRIVCVS